MGRCGGCKGFVPLERERAEQEGGPWVEETTLGLREEFSAQRSFGPCAFLMWAPVSLSGVQLLSPKYNVPGRPRPTCSHSLTI